MADLTISGAFIEEVALATHNSAAALHLPGHLSAVSESVFQSHAVATALRESSVERSQRARITATAIESLAASAHNVDARMTSSDAGLARSAR